VKKNIILLFIVQASNYLFPLLTLPYLMRVLGVANFGVMSIVMAVVQYAIIIVDYGFNFSATRKVALNKNDNKKINHIYTVTTMAKLLLLVPVYVVLSVYIIINGFNNVSYFLLLGSLSVIGSVFFPIWLYQGLEKMQGIAVSSTIAKFLSLLSIFILVQKPEDIDKAIISQSLGYIFTALISFCLLKKLNIVRFTKISFKEILSSYKDGFDLFISNVTISLYTTLNVIIIGYFGDATLAGYFSAADKIRAAAQGILTPVQQAVFPRVCSLVDSGLTLKNVIKMYGLKFIIFSACITLGMAIVGYPLSLWYYGPAYRVSSEMLLIMSPIPFLVGVSIVYGQWWLVNINKTAVLRSVYVFASIFHVAMAIALTYIAPMFGVIISVLITEFLITAIFIAMSYRCRVKA